MAEKSAEKQPPVQQPPPHQSQQQPARPKVKSYLHKFYDHSSSVKDPALYEPGVTEDEDELRRLLNSGRRSGPRGCHLRPVVWKAMLWIGVNCLVFGALGLAIALLLPHEPELVEVQGAQRFVRSRANADWNRSTGIFKYVALGIFGFGALVTAVGLVLPSLIWRLFDEEDANVCSGGDSSSEKLSASGCSFKARFRRQQKPPLGGPASTTTIAGAAAATASAAAAAAAAAATAEVPALSTLVDERQVQPVRDPEGRVSHGQVKSTDS